MTESEERAVARWEVGSCLRMVRKTKQISFEPVFESLHSWSIFLWRLGFHSKSWRYSRQYGSVLLGFRDMTMAQTTDGQRMDRHWQPTHIWSLRRASYKNEH